MHEVCFCGRAGLLEERTPVYLGDWVWGLACPRCGHADDLRWLAEDARRELLEVASRRRPPGDAALHGVVPFVAAPPPREAAS